MIRHLLLDFDRTLNDSDSVYDKNLDGFLGLTGRQVLEHWETIHREVVAKEPKERHEDLELHYNLMIARWRLQDPQAVKEELKRRVRAAQEECWYATALFPDAIPFLACSKDAGYTLHVATGDYARQKADAIERQAGLPLFDLVFDESVLGVGKGKRDYFDRLLAKLAAPPQEVAVIGDSLVNDIGPAREAGIAAIWVRRKNEKPRDGIAPDAIVASLMEALGYLRARPAAAPVSPIDIRSTERKAAWESPHTWGGRCPVVLGMSYRRAFARLVFALASASAIIGIIAAFSDRSWQLSSLGWLTLAVAGMAASIAALADEYVEKQHTP